ncbi:MAG: flagellar brake protein [Oscillospiraceae bacterium]|nr:flagellar brake protein [Oscillospiraceae bacterium]
MNNNVIKPGDKVEIRIIQHVEQGKRLGENPPAYYSMVEDVQENGLIEMLAPTRAGKAESIPGGLRLEFVFYTRRGLYRCVARVKDRYVREHLSLMLVEPKSPMEKFQRREYYRFECVMDMQYSVFMRKISFPNTVLWLQQLHLFCMNGSLIIAY